MSKLPKTMYDYPFRNDCQLAWDLHHLYDGLTAYDNDDGSCDIQTTEEAGARLAHILQEHLPKMFPGEAVDIYPYWTKK